MVDKEKVDRYVRLLDLYGKLLGKTEYEVAQAYLYYGLLWLKSLRKEERHVKQWLNNWIAQLEN